MIYSTFLSKITKYNQIYMEEIPRLVDKNYYYITLLMWCGPRIASLPLPRYGVGGD